MKEKKQDAIKKNLKPYRRRIDQLDDRILALLGDRFGIIREVAKIKIKHDFPAFIGYRVEEVRNRAVAQAKKYGIDQKFIYSLYTLLIYESCATEEMLKLKARRGKTKK